MLKISNLLSSPNLSGEIVYSLDFAQRILGPNQTLILSNVLNSVNLAMITAIDAESNVLMTRSGYNWQGLPDQLFERWWIRNFWGLRLPFIFFFTKSKGIIFYSSFNVSDPTQQHFGHNLNAVYVSKMKTSSLKKNRWYHPKIHKNLTNHYPLPTHVAIQVSTPEPALSNALPVISIRENIFIMVPLPNTMATLHPAS